MHEHVQETPICLGPSLVSLRHTPNCNQQPGPNLCIGGIHCDILVALVVSTGTAEMYPMYLYNLPNWFLSKPWKIIKYFRICKLHSRLVAYCKAILIKVHLCVYLYVFETVPGVNFYSTSANDYNCDVVL